MQDIRQSDNWAHYLEYLGWKSLKTPGGINIASRPFVLGSIVKVQRPNLLMQQDLEEIEASLGKRTMFIKVEPSVEQDLDILTVNSYVRSYAPLLPPATIYINLKKPEEVLWKDISNSGRYSVNRSKREGAKVEFFRNPSKNVQKRLYDVLKDTGKKKQFLVQNFADLNKKIEIFGDQAFAVFSHKKDGTVAGANFYLGYEDNIWFLHGGTTPEGRKGKEGYALVWESFLYFKKLGYGVLDLEGKDDARFPNFTKNWGGFSHFKEKFGGDVVEFPTPYIKYMHPWLQKLSKSMQLNL